MRDHIPSILHAPDVWAWSVSHVIQTSSRNPIRDLQIRQFFVVSWSTNTITINYIIIMELKIIIGVEVLLYINMSSLFRIFLSVASIIFILSSVIFVTTSQYVHVCMSIPIYVLFNLCIRCWEGYKRGEGGRESGVSPCHTNTKSWICGTNNY